MLDDLEQDSRKFGTGKNQPFLAKLINIDIRYHTAAMLSLMRIKSFVFARRASH